MHPTVIGVLLAATQVTGVQLPNPSIFGKPTSEPVRPLLERKPGDAEPFSVLTDIRCGRYSGMTANYPPEVSEASVKAAIRSLYGRELVSPQTGRAMGQWRVEAERFTITVGVERGDYKKGSVHVIYIHALLVTDDPCQDSGDQSRKD